MPRRKRSRRSRLNQAADIAARDAKIGHSIKPPRGRNTSTSDGTRQAVADYFASKNYSVQYEIGFSKWGNLRADVIACNLAGYVVIVEVKSSMADFKTDKKWHKYLPYCNKLYFAIPIELYDKIAPLLPKNVGIIVNDTGTAYIKRKAYHQDADIEKRHEIFIRMGYRSSVVNRFKIKSQFEPKAATQMAHRVVAALKENYTLKRGEVKNIHEIISRIVR